MYYNDLSDTSGGEASRFILQIKHELAKNANITVEEETFTNTAKSSLEVRALCAQKTEETIQQLHYLLGDEEKGLSPTSLSTYLNCPLQYYLRHILNIKDNSVEEETGTDVIGTIIHDTLQFLFDDYLPHDDKPQIIDKKLFDEVIKPRWELKLAQSIAKNTPNGFPDVGYNYLNHVKVEQQLKNYLNYTSKQLENNNLVILKTEEKLKAKLRTDQGEFIVSGRADRIDQYDGQTRVIDYKTGRVDSADLKKPVHHHGETVLEYMRQIPDKALQLLLYKYMYLKENPSVAPETIVGAIHGLKYAHGIEFGLSQATAKKDDPNVDADFLGDATFIADMEAMLKAVIEEMLDTDIPFEQAEDDKKCRYCDFKLICKR